MNKSDQNKWDELCKSIYPISGNGVNFLTSDDKLFKIKDDIEKNTIIKILKRHSINLNSTTILDLGCGTGRLSFFFEKFGAKVIGVDISEEFLKIAKSNKEQLISKVDFIQSDIIGFLKDMDYLDSKLVILSGILCYHNEHQVAQILDLLRAKISRDSPILIKDHISSRKFINTNTGEVEIFFRTKKYWVQALKIFDRKIEFYCCDLYLYSIMRKMQIYERLIKLFINSKIIRVFMSPLDFLSNKVRSYFIFIK